MRDRLFGGIPLLKVHLPAKVYLFRCDVQLRFQLSSESSFPNISRHHLNLRKRVALHHPINNWSYTLALALVPFGFTPALLLLALALLVRFPVAPGTSNALTSSASAVAGAAVA
jgi:hypothetical protein